MKNYRSILGFLAVLLGTFLGSTAYAEVDPSMLEKQKVDVLKQVQNQTNTIKVKKGPVKSKVKVTAAKQKIKANPVDRAEVADSGIQNEGKELKPLDLSIPFQAIEDAGLKNEQNQVVQGRVPNLFSIEKNKTQRPLKLNGGFLMSQEPEAEKQRSLDGAGIRLNLNP